ncbi:MAG: S8 family peptidase [Lachnospiraceae bacterium]
MWQQSQKIENLLNLALEATEQELQESEELRVGFEQLTDTWEIIVKYTGDLKEKLEQEEDIKGTFLFNQYAILEVPKKKLQKIATFWEINYIEKPKSLFFETTKAVESSCVNAVTEGKLQLSGEGVLIAIIDSGIDYRHPAFLDRQGKSRISSIWDQSIEPTRENSFHFPQGYGLGSEFHREEINEAIRENNEKKVPSIDLSGHGTHVAGIAASIAKKAEFVVVKLGMSKKNSFPRTTQLMQAVDYCVKQAVALKKPIAINLSFGNNYGSHSGDSLLEQYLDQVSGVGKNCLIAGTGNEGFSAGHTSGRLNKKKTTEIQLGIGYYETNLNLQIWKDYSDQFIITIQNPSEEFQVIIEPKTRAMRYYMGESSLLVYYGEPRPFSVYQEVYIDFLPRNQYVEPGIWKLFFTPMEIKEGSYNLWLPVQETLSTGTGFLYPSEDTTLTIPSTAAKVITVGAYDAYYDRYASFSGRGYTRQTNQVKPDLVAPGIEIRSATPGGGFSNRSGTSMATPIVTASAALLMEWGIVRENDPNLYGEKVKAYLIKGARQIPGFEEWPNPQMGWGALCLRDSLPMQTD